MSNTRYNGDRDSGGGGSRLALTEARRLLAARRTMLARMRAQQREERQELLEERPLDTADSSVREEGMELFAELEQSELSKLQAIDAAFARIGNGTYGLCVRCDEPIDGPRLRVLPETPLCIRCAQRESDERRGRRSTTM